MLVLLRPPSPEEGSLHLNEPEIFGVKISMGCHKPFTRVYWLTRGAQNNLTCSLDRREIYVSI